MDNSRIYYSPPVLYSNKSSILLGSKSASSAVNNKTSFTQVLTQEINGVQFSQHALDRLQARDIKLGQTELDKLNTAVDKAAQKGAKEALVLMNNNNLALVVSVKNKTVITAMDSVSMKDNIFTNIDSAVII